MVWHPRQSPVPATHYLFPHMSPCCFFFQGVHLSKLRHGGRRAHARAEVAAQQLRHAGDGRRVARHGALHPRELPPPRKVFTGRKRYSGPGAAQWTPLDDPVLVFVGKLASKLFLASDDATPSLRVPTEHPEKRVRGTARCRHAEFRRAHLAALALLLDAQPEDHGCVGASTGCHGVRCILIVPGRQEPSRGMGMARARGHRERQPGGGNDFRETILLGWLRV